MSLAISVRLPLCATRTNISTRPVHQRIGGPPRRSVRISPTSPLKFQRGVEQMPAQRVWERQATPSARHTHVDRTWRAALCYGQIVRRPLSVAQRSTNATAAGGSAASEDVARLRPGRTNIAIRPLRSTSDRIPCYRAQKNWRSHGEAVSGS